MSHHFIQFDNVAYRYPDAADDTLRGVTFRITHGEHVALLGRNGAGKSTAIALIDGLLRASGGEVNIGGIPVTDKTVGRVRQSVGLLFQNPDDQLFMPTVEDDVAFGPRNMRLPEEEVARRVEAALRAVGATELRGRAPYQLSGGQKRTVALATVLSMEPDILVLDEPTANLDWAARRRIIDIVKQWRHTCVIATHDLGLIRELCTRVIILEQGRVIADTTTGHALSDPALLEALSLTTADLQNQ